MSISQFDPAAFLNMTMDTPLEKRDPLPAHNTEAADGCYLATVKEVKSRVWEGKSEKTMGKSGIALDVQLELDVPATLKASQGTDKRIISDSIMLDLTETGQVDNAKGKNGRLRMYREAVDLNKPGDSFAPLKMIGRPLKVKIDHRIYNDTIQEDVKSVMKPY